MSRRGFSGLLRSAAMVSLAGGISKAAYFAALPVLTSYVSPQAFGIYAVFLTVLTLGTVVALAGVDMSYARAYQAEARPNGSAAEQVAWRFTLTAGSLVGLAAGLLWLTFSKNFSLPANYFWLLVPGVLLCCLHTVGLVRARLTERYMTLSVATAMGGVGLAGVSIAVAAATDHDSFALVAGVLASYILPLLVVGAPSPRLIFGKSLATTAESVSMLKVGIAGALTGPSYWAITSLDRWFIVDTLGLESAGIYSLGASVGMSVAFVSGALQSLWLPHAARLYESKEFEFRKQLGRQTEKMIALYICTWVVVSTMGPVLLKAFTPAAFHAAASVVPVLAGVALANSVMHLFNSQLILERRLAKIVPVWISATVIFVPLSLLSTMSMGIIGAALAQLLTFGAICSAAVLLAQNENSIPIRFGRVVVMLVVSISCVTAINNADLAWWQSAAATVSTVLVMIVCLALLPLAARKSAPASTLRND